MNYTFKNFLSEIQQTYELRKPLISRLENSLEANIATYFVSPFTSVNDGDALILDDVLKKLKENRNLILIINGPGGYGLSAERIANVCRTYSKNNQFSVLIPKSAKSAMTMIALSSNEIIVSEISELGPIDPIVQIIKTDERGQPLRTPDGTPIVERYSAHSYVTKYDGLLKKAETTTGNIEPFLMELRRFNAVQVEEMRKAMNLSEDIAIKALKRGMLKNLTKEAIRRKIEIFTNPNVSFEHGRPILADELKPIGLNVKLISSKDNIWGFVNELFLRSDFSSQQNKANLIETSIDSYFNK